MRNYSEYLTKAFFSIPATDKQLILNINNKGGKENFSIGGIRIDKLETANEDFVKHCILECFTVSHNEVYSSNETIAFPTDFREEIYSTWLEKFRNKNINLKIIQSHNNQDVFNASKDNETILFRVWYGTSEQNHTKGFISKIEVVEKTSDCLIHKIKEIIYGR